MLLPFYSDCVQWPRNKLDALNHLVEEGVETNRAAFVRRAGASETTEAWRYPHDYTYWKLPGFRIVWFVNSCIEYVYADPETIDRIQEVASAAAA